MEELNRRRHKNPSHSKKEITGQEKGLRKKTKYDVNDDRNGNILATPADVQKVEHTEYETEKRIFFFLAVDPPSLYIFIRLAASACSAHVCF